MSEGRKKNAVAIDDPRFAKVHQDPRFSRIKRRARVTETDERFKGMYSDPKFVDKRTLKLRLVASLHVRCFVRSAR